MMNQEEEIRMTYSGILSNKGKKTVRIRFERGTTDFAEGTIPEGTITKSSGFSQEELQQLNEYLISNVNNIMEYARLIHPLKSFLDKN